MPCNEVEEGVKEATEKLAKLIIKLAMEVRGKALRGFSPYFQ